MLCSSKRTAVGEVIIPSSQEGITVLRYGAENTRKLSWIEARAGERSTESRRPTRIGSIKLDHAFSDLVRDADGVARVRVLKHQLPWHDG